MTASPPSRSFRPAWLHHLVLLVLLVGAGGVSHALAQTPAVGDGRAALPGFLHTRVASERPRGFALRGLASYGLTESVDTAPGPHHRASLSLGVSGQPLRWLGVGLSLDGRYDHHPNDDSGIVTQTMLEVRATPTLSNGLSLGVAAAVFAYGNTRKSLDLDALSVEGSFLVAYATSRVRLAAEAGYRLDRSAASAPSPLVMLRPGDRLALGVSSHDAILGRLAVSVHVGSIDLYLEGALDALVGSQAPRPSLSPMHAALGVRAPLGDRLLVDGFVDVAASARPTLPNGGPYIRVDPRLTVGVALAYRYGGPRSAASGSTDASDPTVTDPDVNPNTNPDTTPDETEGRTLSGLLLDAQGEPLVDAHVIVDVGDEHVDGYTDGEGHVMLTGIPRGSAVLRVEAVGHAPHVQEMGRGRLTLPDGGLRLVEASAHGTLRGLVLGFDGEPVAARISITPGHHNAESSASDGSFELPLPPGRYAVRVEARGYASQTRDVSLSDGGVTILNLELRRER